MFVVLLKSLINLSLNCALFFFPWCFPPELSQPIVTHCSVLDNCSLGIHFSDFAHSHLVGGPHSHSFLVGLCNVHVLGLGTILGHSCCPNHVGINHDFDNDFLWGSHWSLEEVSVVG